VLPIRRHGRYYTQGGWKIQEESGPDAEKRERRKGNYRQKNK
jgi:hypothetical protein